jgi:hypothetical protein
MSILRGIINNTVSRSLKMARIRALRNNQVALKPVAANMVNSTPTDVGAANRLTNRNSFQAC